MAHGSVTPRLLWISAAACLIAGLCLPAAAFAAPPPVSVFPVPGAGVASPSTQITFRGVPTAQLQQSVIQVNGSRSGSHTGPVLGDSDGDGGSFVPAKPFTEGELVTVSTSLDVLGAVNGRFQFRVAHPAGGAPLIHWPPASRVPGDVQTFRSRADLVPSAVSIGTHARGTAPGDIFLAPQFGPVQDGPMILDGSGNLVWFKRLPGADSASDFRVQSYAGKPVLTWWQGGVAAGTGVGEDVITDTTYRQIAVVHAGNGLSADLHEFELTSRGTALLTAYYPVYLDTSSVHGPKRQIVFDSVAQEIDVSTGLVLFQWDSLDHVPLSDTYQSLPKHSTSPFDYFHVNSIEPDRDGSLIISARDTWAAYKVDKQAGAVIWRLGGRHSSFRLAPGVSWAFQHDVRVRANNDLFVTLFDDGAGPPKVHGNSRGIKLILNLGRMTARQVAQHVHTPQVSANFEGNFQQLPNRDDFIGWGQQPYFSEYDPRGRLVFDGHFVDFVASYRAYRFPWTGVPRTSPAVAASNSARTTTVYASWNGATNVSGWRVIGGPSPTALKAVRQGPARGFETAIRVSPERYVAVEALDTAGHIMRTSATIRSR